MKLLIVNKLYFPWIGGVETFTRQIAEGASNDKSFEVSVLCCQSKGETKKETINNVPVVRAGSWGIVSSMPISFSFFYYFKKMIKNVDLIDLQHPFPLAFLAVYFFRPQAKIIVHYHSDIVRQKIGAFFLKPVINYVLKRADSIIVSNPNMILSSEILSEFKEKCKVIHFGVDPQEIETQKDNILLEEIKKKYGKFILFVGRLNYYKGISYLLAAMKSIDCNLVIVGQGREKDNLLKEVVDLGIEKKVFFVDNLSRKELINYHIASEFFVLPSIYKSETFGMVLLDAMACGKPVITTDLGTGTSYVNIDGTTGFVVEPRNEETLKGSINKLLSNKDLLFNFGENGRKRIISEFNLGKIILDNLDIFKHI